MHENGTFFFLEISDLTATNAGPAELHRKGRIFLENRKNKGANLQLCGQRNELALATPASRSPQRTVRPDRPWGEPVS